MLYLVSYDLTVPGRDYKKLGSRLAQLGAERVLASQWFVVSNGTALELATELLALVDATDRLMVSELTQRSAWRSLVLSDDRVRQWFAHARA